MNELLRPRLRLTAVLTGSLAVLACGSRDDTLDRSLALLPPVALRSTLVMVDRNAPQALLLDLATDPLPTEPIVTPLPHGPSRVERRNGHDEALVLCLGRRANDEHAEEDATLVALEPNGDSREYVLGSPFGRLQQSPDGRYAFLFKSKEGDAERLLENPNEIAIVDLDATPNPDPTKDDSVELRTLRSFGDSPDSVVFSPPMLIAGEERRLAVVLSNTNVTLIDLTFLDRRETTVQLAGEGTAVSRVTPQQVLFNPDAPELYVRGNGSSDVFVFNLSPRAGAIEPDDDGKPRNDFRPFIDQLGVGGSPRDMALYDGGDGARLLVLSAGRLASVVEASTSQVTSVELPREASKLLLFESASPRDDQPGPRALLYEPGHSTIMFLDLADLEERGSRNLETLDLQRPVQSIVPMLEENRVLVLHDGTTVSVVDLASRTAPPIASSERLSDALFDAARERLWVGPKGQQYVAWLALASGDTREVRLDHPVDQLVPLFESGQLAIVHTHPLGLLTVLDVDGELPSTEDARSTRGFFAAGLLDRGE
jgi:hypothetical protein